MLYGESTRATNSSLGHDFCRLHPIHQDTLYSVINVTLPRGKHEKLAKRRAYVFKWKITEKDGTFHAGVEIIRKVCDGNLTCFDVRCVCSVDTCRPACQVNFHSSDGRLLAFGASDYSLGVLDSNTLAVSGAVRSFCSMILTGRNR